MITKVYDTGMEDRSEIVTDENVTSHAPMISMIVICHVTEDCIVVAALMIKIFIKIYCQITHASFTSKFQSYTQ